MLEFALPYLIAIALEMDPPLQAEAMAQAEAAAVAEAPVTAMDSLAGREPEPQVPTGKYTTAVEIKPIMGMTKSNWAAVRLYEGQDLVYFTHMLSWRCGLWEIRYGINGNPADQVFEMEPCHEETAQPNAMTDVANYLPFITLPPESVETLYVEITYDDGTTDFAQFNRNEIEIP